MKRILIAITTLVVGLLGITAFNFLYQQEFVDFLNGLGWHKLAGVASGSWWNNAPTWVLAVAVLTGMWFTWRQIREAEKSTNAHVAIEISRELRGEDNVNLLNEIYSYQPKHLKEELSNERTRKIERVINRLSMLGTLVAKNVIDRELAIKNMAGTTALRCWYQLHPYIKETQKSRGYFGEDFEDFVRRSLDYFRDANIQVLFSREGETEKIDLITKLQEKDFHPRSLKEIQRGRKRTVEGEV